MSTTTDFLEWHARALVEGVSRVRGQAELPQAVLTAGDFEHGIELAKTLARLIGKEVRAFLARARPGWAGDAEGERAALIRACSLTEEAIDSTLDLADIGLKRGLTIRGIRSCQSALDRVSVLRDALEQDEPPAPAGEEDVADVAPATTRRHHMSRLEAKVQAIIDRLDALKLPPCKVVPLTTFAPEPFVLLKDIPVVIEESDGEYMASFFDAGIATMGDNPQEAFDNLKDLILGRFEILTGDMPHKLAPPVKRQAAVLREFIRKTED